MTLFEIFLIAIGLAMDAFAVSVCKGLSMKRMKRSSGVIIGLYFGVFQAIMPLAGYLLGNTFSELIASLDHWIAFILLSVIGGKMIMESYDKGAGSEDKNDKLDVKTMVVLAIATSIDALAVGITFAFFEINIMLAASIIGFVAFTISFIGVIIGSKFGDKFQGKAELIGGVILFLIGLKILVSETFGDGLDLFQK